MALEISNIQPDRYTGYFADRKIDRQEAKNIFENVSVSLDNPQWDDIATTLESFLKSCPQPLPRITVIIDSDKQTITFKAGERACVIGEVSGQNQIPVSFSPTAITARDSDYQTGISVAGAYDPHYTDSTGKTYDNVYKVSFGFGAGQNDSAMFIADTPQDIAGACKGPQKGLMLAYVMERLKKLADNPGLWQKLAADTAILTDEEKKLAVLLDKYTAAVEQFLQAMRKEQITEMQLPFAKNPVTISFKPEDLERTKQHCLQFFMEKHLEQMQQQHQLFLDQGQTAVYHAAFQVVIDTSAATREVTTRLSAATMPPVSAPRIDLIRYIPRDPAKFGNLSKYGFAGVFPGLLETPGIGLTAEQTTLLTQPGVNVYEYDLRFVQGELVLSVTVNNNNSAIADVSAENRFTLDLSGKALLAYLNRSCIDETTARTVPRSAEKPQFFMAQVFEKYFIQYLRDNLLNIPANMIDRKDGNGFSSAKISANLAQELRSIINTLRRISPESSRQFLLNINKRINAGQKIAAAANTETMSIHEKILYQALQALE